MRWWRGAATRSVAAPNRERGRRPTTWSTTGGGRPRRRGRVVRAGRHRSAQRHGEQERWQRSEPTPPSSHRDHPRIGHDGRDATQEEAMRVVVDYDLCESNAICMAVMPEVFEVRDDDFLYVLERDPAGRPARQARRSRPALPQAGHLDRRRLRPRPHPDRRSAEWTPSSSSARRWPVCGPPRRFAPRASTGAIRMVGGEDHLPYDRPPLSKQILAGEWQPDRLVLQPDPVADLGVDLLLGHLGDRARPGPEGRATTGGELGRSTGASWRRARSCAPCRASRTWRVSTRCERSTTPSPSAPTWTPVRVGWS